MSYSEARKATAERPAVPAGPGARRKGEFALALAARIAEARIRQVAVTVPPPVARVLDFLYESVPSLPSAGVAEASPAPDADQDDAASPAHVTASTSP